MRRTALAIRHVAFEDLGSLAGPIERAGLTIAYRDAVDCRWAEARDAELLVVLGGPIGANDDALYPFLASEIAMLEDRLMAGRPTLGICLGAQLIARALGARVYSGRHPEIGWAPLTLTDAGRAGPLQQLEGIDVLHWHGDTFDLPEECERLASTEHCSNQAFARGGNVLGLQFHPEIVAARFEHWLVGHAHEVAANGLDPRALREATARYGAALEAAAVAVADAWLATALG